MTKKIHNKVLLSNIRVTCPGQKKVNYSVKINTKVSIFTSEHYLKCTCVQLWSALLLGVHSAEYPSLSNQQPGNLHSHNQSCAAKKYIRCTGEATPLECMEKDFTPKLK